MSKVRWILMLTTTANNLISRDYPALHHLARRLDQTIPIAEFVSSLLVYSVGKFYNPPGREPVTD
jgi:hypothetical protein